jgi:hypothetical protein
MRILIVVYSFTGNNRLLAQDLARRLGAEIAEVETVGRRRTFTILIDMVMKRRPEVEALRVDPADYDHVIFMAPLWDMDPAYPLATVMRRYRGRVGRYSFITLCGYVRDGQTEHAREAVTRLLERPPDHVFELHVGKLVPPEDRRNVRKVSGHRVTPDELRAFEPEIREIASVIQG